MPFMLSAGVYPYEVDVSNIIGAVDTSIGAIVAEHPRGPVGLNLITSPAQFLSEYKTPVPGMYGAYAALAYLEKSNYMWFNRVVATDATYGGVLVMPSFNFVIYEVVASTKTIYLLGNREDQLAAGQLLYITGSDVTANNINVTVVSATYDSASDKTLVIVTEAVSDADPDDDVPGYLNIDGAKLVSTDNSDKEIVLAGDLSEVLEVGDRIQIYGGSVSGLNGTYTVVTATYSAPNTTIEVSETIPDSTGEGYIRYGLVSSATVTATTASTITIGGVDLRQALTGFSSLVVVGGAAAGTYTVEGVTFTTDGTVITVTETVPSATSGTLVWNPSLINRAFTVGEATPATFNFDGTNAVLSVIAPNPGDWNNNLAIQIQNVDLSANTFDIYLYEFDSTINDYSIVEGFPITASRIEGTKNGYGQSAYVTDIFTPDNKQLIIYDNFSQFDPATYFPSVFTTYLNFDKGYDGGAVTNGQIMTGWDAFEDPDTVNVNILMSAGYTDGSVLGKISEICNSRRDCVGILDTPYGKSAQELVNWRKDRPSGTGLGLNDSYTATYAPWVKVYDQYNDKYVFLPPCGFVGASYAYTDYVSEPWYAPAGLNRGILNVRALEKDFKKGERDVLYQAQVNPIRNYPAGGKVIWGQKTLQTKLSALSSINVRRLLVTIEKAIALSLDYFVFELNDEFTRSQIRKMIEGYMRDIQARRGVYDFRVVCDDRNNTPERIDRNELWVDLYVKPTRVAEYIPFRTIITRTGASFEELISNLS